VVAIDEQGAEPEIEQPKRDENNANSEHVDIIDQKPPIRGLVVCVSEAIAGERGGEAGRVCDRVLRSGEPAGCGGVCGAGVGGVVNVRFGLRDCS
jgi:hypothetical protein